MREKRVVGKTALWAGEIHLYLLEAVNLLPDRRENERNCNGWVKSKDNFWRRTMGDITDPWIVDNDIRIKKNLAPRQVKCCSVTIKVKNVYTINENKYIVFRSSTFKN